MAALSDFTDMQTAVVGVVGRSDFMEWFPTIVQFAESWLNQNLRMREQITSATLTVASGIAPLPSDFIEMIGFYDARGYEYAAQPAQGTRTAASRYYWSIAGTNLVTEAADGAYSAQYYAALPTLTSAWNASNWLLARYPALYLYAVATEAAKWLKDTEMAANIGGMRDMAMTDAMMADNSSRYSRARVRVQGNVP